MPKVSPEHREQKKQQVLEAASLCFAKKGFHACTMQDICRQAGLSPGAVYGYFSSKEAIIQGMSEQEHVRNEAFFQQLKNREDVRQVLDGLIDVFFDQFQEEKNRNCAKLGVMLLSESINNPKLSQLLQANAQHIKGEILEIVENGKRLGKLSREFDSKSFVQALFAMHQGLVSQIVQGEEIDVPAYKLVMKHFIRSMHSCFVFALLFLQNYQGVLR